MIRDSTARTSHEVMLHNGLVGRGGQQSWCDTVSINMKMKISVSVQLAGFELTPLQRLEPKFSTLDHSATLPYTVAPWEVCTMLLSDKTLCARGWHTQFCFIKMISFSNCLTSYCVTKIELLFKVESVVVC